METLNELYSLSNGRSLKEGLSDILKSGDLTVFNYAKKITLRLNDKKVDIDNDKYKVINIAYDNNTTCILCKSNNSKIKYGYYIICHDFEREYTYLLSLLSDKNSFIKNKTMGLHENMLTLVNDEGYMVNIDITNKDTTLTYDLTSYPITDKYIALITNYLFISNEEISNSVLYYEKKIHIFPKGSNFCYVFDTMARVIIKKDAYLDFLIKDVKDVIQLKENGEKGSDGVLAIFSSNESVVVLDLKDFSGYILKTFDCNTNALYLNSEIYIIADTVYVVDMKTLTLEKPFISEAESFGFKTPFILENSITFYKDAWIKSLIKIRPGNTSVININCINDDGETLLNLNELSVLNQEVTINAPAIKGYKTSGENTITLRASEKYYSKEFMYKTSQKIYELRVLHKSNGYTLSEYVIRGIEGEEYNIAPLSITGYIFNNSSNQSGTFSETMNKECILYYSSDTSFNIENKSNTYVCFNCYCNATLMFKKYIPAKKGRNVIVKVPDIPYYTPEQETVALNSVDYSIQEMDINYIKQSVDSVIVRYIADNKIIFETVSKVENKEILLNTPPFLSHKKETLKYLGQIEENIFCSINSPISSLNVLDQEQNILYSIYETGKKRINGIITLENYINVSYEVLESNPLLTENNIYYKQLIFENNIIHKCNDEVLKTQTLKGKDGSICSITPIDDASVECISKTQYIFGPKNKTIEIEYKKKYLNLKTKVIDFNTGKIIKEDNYFGNKGDKIVFAIDIDNKYKILSKDTETNKDVEITLEKDTCYEYIVHDSTIYPLSVKQYRDGISFYKKINYKNLFMVCSHDTQNISKDKKIYISKDVNKTNDDLKELLNRMGLTVFKEIYQSEYNAIESNSLLIDGSLTNAEKFFINANRNDITYIPLDKKYTNIEDTIKMALNDCSYVKFDNFSRIKVEDDLSIGDLSYNKNTRKLHIDIEHHSFSKHELEFNIKIYDANSLTMTFETNLNINTVSNFKNVVYTIDNNLNTEPTFETDINSISYYNKNKEPLIDKMLHCYLLDEVGNRTKTIHEPIMYYIEAQKTSNNYIKDYYRHNLSRMNHRYRGPRESYKFHNFYEGATRTLKEMKHCIDDIKSRIKVKDKFAIEKENNNE